ncbi:MAG: hypothetical protein LUG93_14700 [Lachnospiraceae bacterium]|nr:hypothetical protein [Lachnospiraceae bacterium]
MTKDMENTATTTATTAGRAGEESKATAGRAGEESKATAGPTGEAPKITEPEFGRKETYPDICVCCGRPVPEGRMICWICEHEFDEDSAFRPGR